MKITMTLAAAALLAGTAAVAQTTGSGSTMTPSTGAPATTAPADSTMTAPADPMSSSSTTGASAGTYTQENGKWMVDGRPATPDEVKAHKKSMKKPN